jgi:hypothetical protein
MTTTAMPTTRPTGPNGWLVIGGVFTALLLASGVLSTAGWLGYRTESQSTVYHQAVSSISVDIDTGDLTLTPGEPGTVTVQRKLHWSYWKPVVNEQWDGQHLRVTTDCIGRFFPGPGCEVDYTLAVPEGVSVDAHTSTGDINVRNIRGELRLSTSTGDIDVAGAAAALTLRTSTGDITASGLTSSTVEADTGTGGVTLSLATEPTSVSVQTSTGDVRVVVPGNESYRVRTHTGTGDINTTVRSNDDSSRSITVGTGTGDIDITAAG